MNRFAIRLWFTAFLLTIGWLGTGWVRSGYTFEVKPLKRSLENLPMVLNGYQGKDAPVDEHILKILNADAFLNRWYQRPDGASIAVLASAWVRPESMNGVAIHSPKVCYQNAGWVILEEKNIQTITPEGKLPLCVLLMQREGERCVIAFWYQMGSTLFNTVNEARQAHRDHWGKKQWPATIKVLIQTTSQDIDSALPRIEQFARTLHQWTMDL